MRRLLAFLLLATSFAVLLSGCERVWRLTVIGVREGRPLLCFSDDDAECGKKGVYFKFIEFVRVNSAGRALEEAWAIDRAPDGSESDAVGVIEYGVVPPGWRERFKAKPIEDHAYYQVNGKNYFVRDSEGRYKVLKTKEFYATTR